MKVTRPEQLQSLRECSGLMTVEVDANAFLKGNLPLYLFKYVVWALAEGGSARVTASRSIDSMGIVAGAWSFQFVVQSACKAIEGLGAMTKVDVPGRAFTFTRTSKPLEAGPWSAVVMFSGRKEELPQIEACLQGLLRQPELFRGEGQVAVCGPAEAFDLMDWGKWGADFLPCETPTAAGRFLVGQKKNFAISQMKHERVLICHSRIVLSEKCLSGIPKEFDLITPQVVILANGGQRLPYLDLFFQRMSSVSTYSDAPPPFLGYRRATWRGFLGTHYPYIDGGVFCVRKSLVASVPVSNSLAWGEGEDVEWCRRMLVHGNIVELADNALAESSVNKINRYTRLGHYPGLGPARWCMAWIRAWARRMRR